LLPHHYNLKIRTSRTHHHNDSTVLYNIDWKSMYLKARSVKQQETTDVFQTSKILSNKRKSNPRAPRFAYISFKIMKYI
jgi:hypothetical protein